MKALRTMTFVAGIPMISALGAVACSGDDPAHSAGFVQITAANLAPLAIGCGTTLTNPPKNIAAPDTLLVQLQMVNTTANDVTVTAAASSGVIVVSTDPNDVGNATANFSSIPFTPSPALLVARLGNRTLRVSVPMEPVCQSKPIFYTGEQDINISARMTATSGQYVTEWATIKVTWQ